MEEVRGKSPSVSDGVKAGEKRRKTNPGNDTVADMILKLLETEVECSKEMKVKFVENPYSSLEIFHKSCSFVTINGNEESCGSSYSDFGSSAMVSIDLGVWGSAKLFRDCDCDGMDGLDWFGDSDDERLLRFIGEEISETV